MKFMASAGMTKLLLGPEMIPFMAAMGTIIFSRSSDDTVCGEGGNDTIYLSAGADIEDGGEGNDTTIFGPDQTTLPVTPLTSRIPLH